MTSTSTNNDISVSLEDHLRENLKPLLPILPPDLSDLLTAELNGTEIHYSLLSNISRWTRSDDGLATLQSKCINPNSYLMVSLLAGTRTAPSSKPPPYRPPDSPELNTEFNDRKALTAVLNGLLSIGCSGGAAWWAADKSGWRDEWKVLLALFVAAVVGFSETILYIIWQSRRSRSDKAQAQKMTKAGARSKKTDGDYCSVLDHITDARVDDTQGVAVNAGQIRHRAVHHSEE